MAVASLATSPLVYNLFGPGLCVDTDNEHVTCQQIGASHVKMNNRNKGTIYKTSEPGTRRHTETAQARL